MSKHLMKVIDHQFAYKLLKELTVQINHPLGLHPELDASITDWLQNIDRTPIFGDKGLRNAWIKHLEKHVSLGRMPSSYAEVKTSEGKFAISFDALPFPPPEKTEFKFIDLFAGIGGFRLALQSAGGKCVFSSEWDKGAKATYFKNFGDIPFGDINQFSGNQLSDDEVIKLIPDHDVLAGGFPCQPFSLAGVSARTSLGKNHGFACETQGTLFFNIVRIALLKKPKVLFLENVKNLARHDGGKTFAVIKSTIENDLGYTLSTAIINASSLVPQKRERFFMVAFRDGEQFSFPDFSGNPLPLKSILESSPLEKYTISDKLWAGHINRTKRNLERGTGFTAYTADIEKPANTLVARYGKDGKECLVPQQNKNPRKLTPRECARLQGFPESFALPESDTPAYRQFGNSVAVPVVEKLAQKIANNLRITTKDTSSKGKAATKSSS